MSGCDQFYNGREMTSLAEIEHTFVEYFNHNDKSFNALKHDVNVCLDDKFKLWDAERLDEIEKANPNMSEPQVFGRST